MIDLGEGDAGDKGISPDAGEAAMRIITILIGMMLFSGTFWLNARSEEMEERSGTATGSEQEKTEVSEQIACQCCKTCLAAKKSTGHVEEGPPATNGCRDCCKRCGKPLLPVPEKIPPEIIEKR